MWDYPELEAEKCELTKKADHAWLLWRSFEVLTSQLTQRVLLCWISFVACLSSLRHSISYLPVWHQLVGLSGFLMICGFFYKSFAILSLCFLKFFFFPNLLLSFGLCEFILSLPFRLLAFLFWRLAPFSHFYFPPLFFSPLSLVSEFTCCSPSCCWFYSAASWIFFGSFLFDFWIVLVQWAFFSHCTALLLLSPFKVLWFVCLFFPIHLLFPVVCILGSPVRNNKQIVTETQWRYSLLQRIKMIILLSEDDCSHLWADLHKWR